MTTSTMIPEPERLRSEIERLAELRRHLDRDMRQVKFVGLGFLGVPIAYKLEGAFMAATVGLLVVSLAATAYYLIKVRQREYASEIQFYQESLERLEESESLA